MNSLSCNSDMHEILWHSIDVVHMYRVVGMKSCDLAVRRGVDGCTLRMFVLGGGFYVLDVRYRNDSKWHM